MPPMIPVMMPAAGGTPHAMATPMHKGKATRNTTTEASRSLFNQGGTHSWSLIAILSSLIRSQESG